MASPRFTETLRQILHLIARPGATDMTMQDVAFALGTNRATVHQHYARLVQLEMLTMVERGRYAITERGRAALTRQSKPGSAVRTMHCPGCNRKLYI